MDIKVINTEIKLTSPTNEIWLPINVRTLFQSEQKKYPTLCFEIKFKLMFNTNVPNKHKNINAYFPSPLRYGDKVLYFLFSFERRVGRRMCNIVSRNDDIRILKVSAGADLGLFDFHAKKLILFRFEI